MHPQWPLRARISRAAGYLFAVMILAWLGTIATVAIAGRLEVDDGAAFNRMQLRMRAVADQFSAMRPRDVREEAKQPDRSTHPCANRLADDLATIEARFDHLGVLVGSAAGSVDTADPVLTRVLGADASALLEQLRFHRQLLTLALRKCAPDAAAQTKGEDIARLYDDASLLVKAIIQKIGTSNLSR